MLPAKSSSSVISSIFKFSPEVKSSIREKFISNSNILNIFSIIISSSTFLFAIRELSHYYSRIEDDSELLIAFEQWKLFLSIAYGSFKATTDVFLIHTYLSVFSKILAYAVITKHQFITDDEMKDILSGEIFNKLNVNNFIESDFYHWIAKDR
ncbi:MAG: hypothetical protein KJ770_09330, partial [Actinobacteria bacterium]|nr:hypothetical protein [Actinomycetota bacterium]